ncbi:MAG: AAA family ATPase, partial [Syntrophothermus sp.]
IVNDSMGGILFVDEAYSLKKENSGQDFGQEAIDIILKRMEDAQGQFVVIAAGYPEEMKFFINSNPGLKSRFTHFFNFEDYNPDELIEIFKVFASSEEFSIEPDATEILKNYFNDAYKKRDESFGNARLVRKLFNEVKILLGKRYLKEKNKEVLTTINVDDIEALLKKRGYKKHDKNLNEEKLEILLKEINSIAGISLVKKDIVKLVDSLKLSRLREERGLSVIKRNLNSIFVGNKGTGKTIIAAKLGLIFKELGVLNNGHLIEVDKTSLHSINTIDELLKNAEGGILLIKEVDKIVKENLKVFDKLIKRLEEQNFDVIVILTGTNNGITEILENIPSLKNIFMKQFYFQDLNPRELLESTLSLTEKAGYKLDEGAWQMLHDIFNSEYQNKKTGFTNSDLVKNFLFKALNNQEERILKINNPDNEQLCTITLEDIEKINYNY